MFKYFQTTTLILLWSFFLTLLWAAVLYGRATAKRGASRPAPSTAGLILPALVAAPLVLVVAFRVFGVNLLFPVHFFAGLGELVGAALVPALVLSVSSGLWGILWREIPRELAHWQSKTFVRLALAVGQRPARTLRRLVLGKALAKAWSQGLPWLFGELVIVECVFNAPGLGLDAWHLARQRDLAGFAVTVAWLAGLYGLAVLATALTHGWLGRRLDTYG